MEGIPFLFAWQLVPSSYVSDPLNVLCMSERISINIKQTEYLITAGISSLQTYLM